MNSSQIVDSILSARYLLTGEKTFEDICRRVARAIAGDEEEAMHFYDIMVSLHFLPNSPTLMNAGTELGQTLCLFRPACTGFSQRDLRCHEKWCNYP